MPDGWGLRHHSIVKTGCTEETQGRPLGWGSTLGALGRAETRPLALISERLHPECRVQDRNTEKLTGLRALIKCSRPHPQGDCRNIN